jgi:hypothetical protein
MGSSILLKDPLVVFNTKAVVPDLHHTGCSEENPAVPLDEEVIPAATYDPNNDVDKEDSSEDSGPSDDYAAQVKKVFGSAAGSSKSTESHWMAGDSLDANLGQITHALLESAKQRSSSVKITELHGELSINENDSGVHGETQVAGDINMKELLNPCDMLRSLREERRASERIQKGMMEAGSKLDHPANKKRSLEGNTVQTSNAFSALADNEVVDRSNSMGVVLNDTNFESINILKDLETARFALNKKLQDNLNQVNPEPSVVEVNQKEDDCEQNLLHWIEEDNSDIEDFILVTPKRVRRSVKRLSISGEKI